jgi:hypothetical protein
MLCQHDEVTLIFTVMIIDNDEHLTASKAIEGIGEINQHHVPL